MYIILTNTFQCNALQRYLWSWLSMDSTFHLNMFSDHTPNGSGNPYTTETTQEFLSKYTQNIK